MYILLRHLHYLCKKDPALSAWIKLQKFYLLVKSSVEKRVCTVKKKKNNDNKGRSFVILAQSDKVDFRLMLPLCLFAQLPSHSYFQLCSACSKASWSTRWFWRFVGSKSWRQQCVCELFNHAKRLCWAAASAGWRMKVFAGLKDNVNSLYFFDFLH